MLEPTETVGRETEIMIAGGQYSEQIEMRPNSTVSHGVGIVGGEKMRRRERERERKDDEAEESNIETS